MIGRSVALAVQRSLTQLARSGRPGLATRRPRKVLVLGYGAVGSYTARELRRLGYEVSVMDPKFAKDPALRRRAERAGFQVYADKRDALRSAAQVIVSATGKRSLQEQDLPLLAEGTILFNAGSRHSEFPASLREGRYAHRVLLMQGGAPINFGGIDPIPARYIQLTRGLLYLGAIQAVSCHEARLHTLKLRPQRQLVHDIQQELKQQQLGTLGAPLFGLSPE